MFFKLPNSYDKVEVLKHKTAFTSGHQSCYSILVRSRRHLLPEKPHFCGIIHIESQPVSPSFPGCLHMEMQQWQNDSFITQSLIYDLFDGCPCHGVTWVGDTSAVAELLCWRSPSAPTEVQCEYGHFCPQTYGVRCFSLMFKPPPFMLRKREFVIVAQLTHMPLFFLRTETCVWILIGQITTSNCLNVSDDVLLISSRAAAVQLEGTHSTLCNWLHKSSGWCIVASTQQLLFFCLNLTHNTF